MTRQQGGMWGRVGRPYVGGRQREGAGRGHPGDADHVGARAQAARASERRGYEQTALRGPSGAAFKNARRRRRPAATRTATRTK